MTNGILINEITYHFPVFTLCEFEVIKTNPEVHKYSEIIQLKTNSFAEDFRSEKCENAC